MTVRWQASAIADIVRIVSFIALENPVAARQFGRALLAAGDRLKAFPKRGRIGRDGTRELVTIRPYLIVYELDGADDVRILRIWHSAQDRA